MDLRHLDDVTRSAMLAEVEHDIAADALYLSPRLSPQGVNDYPDLLRDAIQIGDDETLATALSSNGQGRSGHRQEGSCDRGPDDGGRRVQPLLRPRRLRPCAG